MSAAIRLEVLPARLGDCLLVECLPAEDDRPPWRMLVDGGPPDCWASTLRPRLERLPEGRRRLDVVVVSHIDSDHIGGLIPLFRDQSLGLDIGDVWFNGSAHITDPVKGEPRGFRQGEHLAEELLGDEQGPAYPWNRAFAGGPVVTPDEATYTEVSAPGAPRLTLLSPTTKRVQKLWGKWWLWLEEARSGGDVETELPPPPPPLGDLHELAAAPKSTDPSYPNGSSIALLVEHRGASCVLAADAFGNLLTTALAAVAVSRGLPILSVDAVKLPHHGSRNNVPSVLMQAVSARHWMVSSNGDRFGHPDDVALARVVVGAARGSTLWFNYRNERTSRWDDPALRERHGYDVRYPDPAEAGAVLELEAKP